MGWFYVFVFREMLTEDNPWYCPQCKENQAAAKVMSVTRWPRLLIIHLKRSVQFILCNNLLGIVSRNKQLEIIRKTDCLTCHSN